MGEVDDEDLQAIRNAFLCAEAALEGVLFDEETIKADLWRRRIIPRTLEMIRAALALLDGRPAW